MIFHHPTQTCFRQRANSRFRQQSHQPLAFSLPGDRRVWLAIRNMLFVLCPIVLAVNLWSSHICTNLEQSVQRGENVRQELAQRQVNLRAKRDHVYSPEFVLMLASKRLSLHVPDKQQVDRHCLKGWSCPEL